MAIAAPLWEMKPRLYAFHADVRPLCCVPHVLEDIRAMMASLGGTIEIDEYR
ncbi:hypothetical protein [Burkholderia sp. lig30]|jgi:hypothetical protein|uniref:hypothetical protein n=1 Tax=Burkholderia sp. lig30 TaxID=1192124 RepID=UPI000AC17F47|nr:hypothetical protein [Burkholderia sp. lig30]